MRHFGNLALIILAISVLSYGFSGLSFAQQTPEDCEPDQVYQLGQCQDIDEEGPKAFAVDTDQPSYDDGDTIRITGNVGTISKDFPNTPLTIIITGPTGNIVGIAQVTPAADGQFSHEVIAGGTMNASGDYKVSAQYGTQKSSTAFSFTASGFTPPPVTECGPNQILVNGKCVKQEPEPEPEPTCGPGTELKNGVCVPIGKEKPKQCLIATAAFGSELAPQVQFLREVRDNTLLSTSSGAAFMTAFNAYYYSFAPTVAEWEQQNPVFKEAVKLFITPMITSLSIMSLANEGSEADVLILGISAIALNLGMYIVAPTAFAYKMHKHYKSRK